MTILETNTMKYLIILLLPISALSQQFENGVKHKSKLFNGNSIATYSLFFIGGFSDGLNDCVVANKFYSDPFWGLDAWKNKSYVSGFRAKYLTFTCDGWHLTKFASPVFYSAAIGINLGDKQNWKYYVAKGLISLAASRLGHELCYNVIFNK